MGLAASEWPRGSRVLLVETSEEPVGLLVDAVTQVRRLPDSALEKKPQLDDSQAAERVIYVARPDPTTQVTVIDLVAVMSEAMR